MKRSPQDTITSARKITRRGLILGGAQAALVGALTLRMRYLQVDQAEQYRMLAEENRINIRLLAPARGLIFDRNGVPLAENAQNYRIVMVREDAGDVDEVIARLGQLVELPQEALERAMKEMKKRSPFVPITIADRLSWEDFSQVAVNAPALPGITPEVGLSRSYPYTSDFAHVVGYVGPVSEYDLGKIEDQDPLLQIPEFQIGKSGVEVKLEKSLRGSAGNKQIEVNAVGRVMRELGRQEGKPGANVQLTIDATLQNYVQARLEGESAAAVVIDTETGDLLAIGSTPSFDPNKFVRGISSNDYKQLTGNKYRPLASKSVQGTYPPGSTVKMATTLAALAEGVIPPDELIFCAGYITVGNRRFHCWKRGGHGQVDLHNSLKQSCDVYYYEIAQRVGIDKIAAMARRLGLGRHYNLPMSAVAKGLIPTKAWKESIHGENWQIGDTLNATIGQGYVLASPLQLSVMTARLATGRAITPRLVRSTNEVDEPILDGEDLGIDPEHLRLVRKAMFAVSNERGGTGYRSRIIQDEYRLAGKSGTSQVRGITMAQRAKGLARDSEIPWEFRDHALFVSYAPFDKPKIAISVVVEHGGGGSKAAAPIVRDIALQALYGGTPPLEAYPAKDREKIRLLQDSLPLRPPQMPSNGRDRA